MCRGPRSGPATARPLPAITRSSRRLIPSFALLARYVLDRVAVDGGYIPNYPNFRRIFKSSLRERVPGRSFRIFAIVEKIVYYTPLFAGVLWSPNYVARGGCSNFFGGVFRLFTWIWTYYTPLFRSRREGDSYPDSRFFLRRRLVETLYYTPLFYDPREPNLRPRVLALTVAPPLPRFPERGLRDLQFRPELALVLEEPLEHVRLCAVLRGGPVDRLRATEPVAVPCHAPRDSPREHPGQLLPQLLGEVGVRAVAVEPLGKRDEPQPVPYRLGPVGDLRLVVRAHPQLELRTVRERLSVRGTGAYGVVTRDLLNRRLLKLDAPLRLGDAHEPPALQCREGVLRGRVRVLLLHNHVRVRHTAVVPEQVLKGLDQRRLPVLPDAVQHREGALFRGPGKTVPEEPLHKGDQLLRYE